jgi:prepilin-type N-terminal cleavage/methylation domain-containing protein
MEDKGHTLVELLVVVFLITMLATLALPQLKAYSVEAHILGAGRVFKGEFLRARSIAIRTNRQTAIRFEQEADGRQVYSIYGDGNQNGVTSRDIERGVDVRISGPVPLTGGAPSVRVGILPGIPAPPPDHGTLATEDPIRFGRSNMVSFSPLGTASPGTFYLAGYGIQGAVRVTPGSSRVRLLICRGKAWRER